MSNSTLVDVVALSPYFSRRTHAIDTITIHCMAGKGSASACGAIFQQPGRNASSNYGIGYSGEIGLYVEEEKASWCSSNGKNDNRAITIEVANSATPRDGHPEWPVSQASWDSLIELCADICKRNSIKRLVWSDSRDERINHKNGCNMTVHRDFSAKSCPGDYLFDRIPVIAAEVNRKLEAMEDADMTGEEIWRRLCDYLNGLPESEYAREASRKGIESGLFLDGDNDGLVDSPRAPVTRQDLAVVLERAGMLRKTEAEAEE